jgi:hypothetical protein
MVGKATRITRVSATSEKAKRNPLYFQIKEDEDSGILSTKSLYKTNDDAEMNLNEPTISNKTTKKILSLSRKQLIEEEEEQPTSSFDNLSIPDLNYNQDTANPEDDAEDWYNEDGDDELVEISAEDEEMLNKYMIHVQGNSSKNLANMILEQIQHVEKQNQKDAANGVSQKIVDVYTQ